MKARLQQWPGNSTLRFSAPVLALSLLLVALPAGADTDFITTNWVAGVPVPGILCTNGLGQVHIKGNVHVHRVVSAEARIAGRLQAWMDLAYQTDGTAILGGPAYAEVGTWDAAGTTFTPSGGVWDLKYSGVAQVDGSDQVHLVGYGIGGAIDGLRVEITATKGPGAPFDPTVPYVSSGTIQPAPVNTSAGLDDFEDGIVKTNWIPWGPTGSTTQLIEANGQLTVRGVWIRPATLDDTEHTGAYWNQNWSVVDGQTLEWRADVLSMNQDASGLGLGVGTASQRFYVFKFLGDSVSLDRWAGSTATLFRDSVTLRQTNVVLSFALTRRQSKAVVTIRVLDKGAQDAILYQKIFPDNTPYLSGNNAVLAVVPKPGLPSSVVTATFDNFEQLTYEVPQVAIERAARLTWPDTGMNFDIEVAPTVQGPWLPFEDSVPPGMQQLTVPSAKSAEFFRLRLAP
jgi:hypothetical protein